MVSRKVKEMEFTIKGELKEIVELLQTVGGDKEQRHPKYNLANVTIDGKELSKALNEEVKRQHRQPLDL